MLTEGEILWTLYKARPNLTNWETTICIEREWNSDGAPKPKHIVIPLANNYTANEKYIYLYLAFSAN